MWTLEEAVTLARLLEPIAQGNKMHVALTGGCLYKDGSRKDADIVVYRHSDEETYGEPLRRETFENELSYYNDGLCVVSKHPRVTKCTYFDKPFDLIFIEVDGCYQEVAPAPSLEDEPVF